MGGSPPQLIDAEKGEGLRDNLPSSGRVEGLYEQSHKSVSRSNITPVFMLFIAFGLL